MINDQVLIKKTELCAVFPTFVVKQCMDANEAIEKLQNFDVEYKYYILLTRSLLGSTIVVKNNCRLDIPCSTMVNLQYTHASILHTLYICGKYVTL